MFNVWGGIHLLCSNTSSCTWGTAPCKLELRNIFLSFPCSVTWLMQPPHQWLVSDHLQNGRLNCSMFVLSYPKYSEILISHFNSYVMLHKQHPMQWNSTHLPNPVAHPNVTDPGLQSSPEGRFGIIPSVTDCQSRVMNSSSLPISQPGL